MNWATQLICTCHRLTMTVKLLFKLCQNQCTVTYWSPFLQTDESAKSDFGIVMNMFSFQFYIVMNVLSAEGSLPNCFFILNYEKQNMTLSFQLLMLR